MLLTDIADYYQMCSSVRQTARKFGLSACKVTKCLITVNIYPSETAQKIMAMRDKEMTEREISERLGISLKALNKYTPYSKVIYNDNPSENAVTIKRCRERKKMNSEQSK